MSSPLSFLVSRLLTTQTTHVHTHGRRGASGPSDTRSLSHAKADLSLQPCQTTGVSDSVLWGAHAACTARLRTRDTVYYFSLCLYDEAIKITVFKPSRYLTLFACPSRSQLDTSRHLSSYRVFSRPRCPSVPMPGQSPGRHIQYSIWLQNTKIIFFPVKFQLLLLGLETRYDLS